MAKSVISEAADAYLERILAIAAAGDLAECLCTQQPTTYAEATATYKLAQVTLSPGDLTGPSTGDISGRKLVVAQKGAVPLTASGNGQHVALVDIDAQELLAVTVCPVVALVSGGGNTATIASWKLEVQAPV